MPFITAAIIGGVASVAGAALSSEGQADANESNRQQSRESNEFNSAQSALTRDFQERMSNTSYQRAMADMRAAGLNPVLAASRGGASTPSGATASAVAPTPNLNTMAPYGDAASRVAQIGHTVASAEQARAQTRNLDADTANKEASLPYYAGQSTHQAALVANLDANTNLSKEQAHKVGYEVANILQRTHLDAASEKLVYEQINNAIKEGRRIEAHTGNYKADTALKQVQTRLQHLEIPGATGKADWHRTYPTASRERNWPDVSVTGQGIAGYLGLGTSSARDAVSRSLGGQGLKGPSASGKIRW